MTATPQLPQEPATGGAAEGGAAPQPRREGRRGLRPAGRSHGRLGLCGGAVLQLVLPRHRLQRNDAGRQGAPKAAPLARTVAVRFDSNVSGGLPWKFEPEQTEIKVRIGEVATVYYTVANQSARTTMGQAAYNVTPLTIGSYFTKINCFCFTEQTMAPGEKREMAVVFYVDPAFAADSENDGVNTITLSYTFYPVKDPAPKPVAASEPDKRKGNI